MISFPFSTILFRKICLYCPPIVDCHIVGCQTIVDCLCFSPWYRGNQLLFSGISQIKEIILIDPDESVQKDNFENGIVLLDRFLPLNILKPFQLQFGKLLYHIMSVFK